MEAGKLDIECTDEATWNNIAKALESNIGALSFSVAVWPFSTLCLLLHLSPYCLCSSVTPRLFVPHSPLSVALLLLSPGAPALLFCVPSLRPRSTTITEHSPVSSSMHQASAGGLVDGATGTRPICAPYSHTSTSVAREAQGVAPLVPIFLVLPSLPHGYIGVYPLR